MAGLPRHTQRRFRRRPAVWFQYALVFQVSVLYAAYPVEADDNYNSNNNCGTPLSTCDGSVIEVTNINWYCDSPYAYYWGGGAHRNSQICAYNDKVTFEVTFQVQDDLSEVNDAYMVMAVQDSGSQNVLKGKGPSYLCKNYVGSDCTAAGEYQFSLTIKLGASSSNNNNAGSSSKTSSDDFCPTLLLAFSTEADSGYNLGALNMQCQSWNNEFVAWANQKPTPRDWIRNYGMILGTCVCLLAFAGFLWQQARRVTTFGACIDPCASVELDQYYKCPYPYPGEQNPISSTNPIPNNTFSANNLDTSNHSGLPVHQQSPKRPLHQG